MAKSQAQKDAEKKAQAEADAQIFGGATPTPPVDPVGIVPPAPNGETGTAPRETGLGVSPAKEDTVTISRSQLEAIMGRLGDLESVALSRDPANKDDVFNPLAEVKSDHQVHVVFHGDELVVGFKEKVRPDGRKTHTWLQKEPTTGEIRTYVTLYLRHMETKEVREETVDLVAFIEGAVPMLATIKDRKDIGEIVEHGLVNQMTWNGRALVPTNTKVMTGAKEQRFIFDILLANGEVVKLPQDVINIKS